MTAALAYSPERAPRQPAAPQLTVERPSTQLTADEVAALMLRARSWDELLALAQEVWRFPVETAVRSSERARLCDVLASEIERRWGRREAARRRGTGME